MSGRRFWISVLCTLSLLIFGLQTLISKVKHQTSHDNIFPLYFEHGEGPLNCSTLSFWYRFDLITTRYHHNRGRRARFFSSRVSYYPNSNATFHFERISVSGDVSPNPGPTTTSRNLRSTRQTTQSQHDLKCLYFNPRSIVNKTRELEVIANSKQYDLIGITETWLNDSISNNDCFPRTNTIYTAVTENCQAVEAVLCSQSAGYYNQFDGQI